MGAAGPWMKGLEDAQAARARAAKATRATTCRFPLLPALIRVPPSPGWIVALVAARPPFLRPEMAPQSGGDALKDVPELESWQTAAPVLREARSVLPCTCW